MSCVGYLLLFNKSAPSLVAKKYQTLLSPSFCGLGIQGLAYLGASASKSLARLQVLSGFAVSFEASAERGSGFEFTHVVVGGIQLLTGCWTECLSSSLAVGCRSPSVPFHTGLSIRQVDSITAS